MNDGINNQTVVGREISDKVNRPSLISSNSSKAKIPPQTLILPKSDGTV